MSGRCCCCLVVPAGVHGGKVMVAVGAAMRRVRVCESVYMLLMATTDGLTPPECAGWSQIGGV